MFLDSGQCQDTLNMCLQDMHNELQDVMGQSFGVPDDIDESELMGELDALEDELAMEAENPTAGGVPSYLQVCTGLLGQPAVAKFAMY
jgi:charged multivesicular body protein 5